MILSPPVVFNLESACATPYASAPSSPKGFGTSFFSAPTSPTRIPALSYTKPKETNAIIEDDEYDFAFEFSGNGTNKNSTITAADELFDGGKIKPLRSLSSLRVSDLLLFDDIVEDTNTTTASNSSVWYKKWNLKDLLLFRSASESRATSSTEELNKYELVKKARQEHVIKNSSESSSKRRKSRPISAHELHYKMKRETLKEMKNKTFLPYKQGLLGCSGLDTVIPDAIFAYRQ